MRWYLMISPVVFFVATMQVPKGKRWYVDNVVCLVVLSMVFGWIMWPIAVAAALKSRVPQRVK